MGKGHVRMSFCFHIVRIVSANRSYHIVIFYVKPWELCDYVVKKTINVNASDHALVRAK